MNARELLDINKANEPSESVYNDNLQVIYNALDEDGLLESRIFEGNVSLAYFLFEVIKYTRDYERQTRMEHQRLKDPKKFMEWVTEYGKKIYFSILRNNEELEPSDAIGFVKRIVASKLYQVLHGRKAQNPLD